MSNSCCQLSIYRIYMGIIHGVTETLRMSAEFWKNKQTNRRGWCKLIQQEKEKKRKKVRTESAVILWQMSFCGKNRITNKQHGRMCNKTAIELCLLQAAVKDTRTIEEQAPHKTTFQFIVQYVKSSAIWRRTFDHLKEKYQTGAFHMSSIWRSIRIRERCQLRHQKFLEWLN